jgi:hypothetical protein
MTKMCARKMYAYRNINDLESGCSHERIFSLRPQQVSSSRGNVIAYARFVRDKAPRKTAVLRPEITDTFRIRDAFYIIHIGLLCSTAGPVQITVLIAFVTVVSTWGGQSGTSIGTHFSTYFGLSPSIVILLSVHIHSSVILGMDNLSITGRSSSGTVLLTTGELRE